VNKLLQVSFGSSPRISPRASLGDHVAPIIAQERQQKGEIPKGKIASVSGLREIDPFLGSIRN
jgi:hypothetical protein